MPRRPKAGRFPLGDQKIHDLSESAPCTSARVAPIKRLDACLGDRFCGEVPIGTCRTLLRSAPISSTQRKPLSSEKENKATAIFRGSLNIGDARWWRCATVAAHRAVSLNMPKAIWELYAGPHMAPRRRFLNILIAINRSARSLWPA